MSIITNHPYEEKCTTISEDEFKRLNHQRVTPRDTFIAAAMRQIPIPSNRIGVKNSVAILENDYDAWAKECVKAADAIEKARGA